MDEHFRLDRTAFSATTVKEASKHKPYWDTRPLQERLEAAMFLTMHAYGLDINTRLDKTIFAKRKR